MSIFKKGFGMMSRRKRREKGIALIFTLGILGLLTVLALGFASTDIRQHLPSAEGTIHCPSRSRKSVVCLDTMPGYPHHRYFLKVFRNLFLGGGE